MQRKERTHVSPSLLFRRQMLLLPPCLFQSHHVQPYQSSLCRTLSPHRAVSVSRYGANDDIFGSDQWCLRWPNTRRTLLAEPPSGISSYLPRGVLALWFVTKQACVQDWKGRHGSSGTGLSRKMKQQKKKKKHCPRAGLELGPTLGWWPSPRSSNNCLDLVL